MSAVSFLQRHAMNQAAGVQRTRSELESLAWMAEMRAVNAHIAAKSPEERQELSADALALVRSHPSLEARRAAAWHQASAPARKVALMAANINPARQSEPLDAFDAFERGRVWMALRRLIADFADIAQAMQGGEIKLRAEACHAPNGIAAMDEVG